MRLKGYQIMIISVIVGIFIGILANRNRSYLVNAQFIRDHLHFRKKLDIETVRNSNKVMVCLAFGQSNSANYGNGTYKCRNKVYNFYKGSLYLAKEPLLGPDGGGCSVWTRVSDMLIDSGLYEKVVIVPIGIGGTSIECWVSGDCRNKLDETLDQLIENKIQLTHIFWNQGETDNVEGTSKSQYKHLLTELVSVIRNKGFNAPFYTSITSYFPYDNDYPFGINPQITNAQMELAKERSDILLGPNTDSINLAYERSDGVHFTENGLNSLARSWFKEIKLAK